MELSVLTNICRRLKVPPQWSKKYSFIDIRYGLSKLGVPPNSVLVGGTVPPNSVLFGGTVPPNTGCTKKKYTSSGVFKGTLGFNKTA